MSKNNPPSDKKRPDPKNLAQTGQGLKQNPLSSNSKKGTTLGAHHSSHGDSGKGKK